MFIWILIIIIFGKYKRVVVSEELEFEFLLSIWELKLRLILIIGSLICSWCSGFLDMDSLCACVGLVFVYFVYFFIDIIGYVNILKYLFVVLGFFL